jgi:hypothetical protein
VGRRKKAALPKNRALERANFTQLPAAVKLKEAKTPEFSDEFASRSQQRAAARPRSKLLSVLIIIRLTMLRGCVISLSLKPTMPSN